jgi:hypothetical protein
MGITPTPILIQDLIKYGINLPSKRETTEYKEQVKKFKTEPLYVKHLREQVKTAKAKEAKTAKKYEADVKKFIQKEAVRLDVEKLNGTKISYFYKQKLEYYKDKLFYSIPTESAWKSYTKYVVWNDRPEIVGIPYTSFTEVEQQIRDDGEYKPYSLTSYEIGKFFTFYKIRKFLEKSLNMNGTSKFFITINMEALDHGIMRDFSIVAKKAERILSNRDIDRYVSDLYSKYDFYREKNYLYLYNIKNVEISIYKPKSLNGKSWVELPEFLKNSKKGLINIKNTDTKCFLYSVYCSLFTPPKNPDRVSHYKNLNSLIYNEEHFVNGMCIDNIPIFEEQNKLKVYVYGLVDEDDKENKGIELKYKSEFYQNEEYKMVQLFLYKQHYVYIKNFNGLMGDKNNRNKVCPYCCDFVCRDNKLDNFEKHKKECLKCNGSIIKMPENDTIKFKNFSKMNEMPIRIYADFETFNDASMCHKSKNENTEFSTGHKPASFKLVVISDIPVNNWKVVNNKYTYEYMYDGVDSDIVFVNKLNELEENLMTLIEETIKQYKDVKNMKFSKEDRHTHYSNKNCLICNCSYTDDNRKVRHHSHTNGKYIAPLCNNCNLKIKDKKFLPVFFHNLNYDKNVFFKALISRNEGKKVSILPDNKNCFKSFEVGNFHFIDSFRFVSSSLAELIKNLPENSMYMLKSIAKNEEELMFMKKKAHFPYEWFDCINKLDLPIDVLKKEYFDNKMNCSVMSLVLIT